MCTIELNALTITSIISMIITFIIIFIIIFTILMLMGMKEDNLKHKIMVSELNEMIFKLEEIKQKTEE